jgi:hypothetical protein
MGRHYILGSGAVTSLLGSKPASRLMSADVKREPSWLQPGGAKM